MLPWVLCGALFVIAAALLVKIVLLQKSMGEIGAALREHLAEDTNTLISVSCQDRYARRLAAEINTQLRLLRKQRRQYQNGDRELKEAVTNISHDLRTPLTSIFGYLELCAQEEKTEALVRYLAFIEGRAVALKRLTEELFEYSLIFGTKDSLKFESVNINAVLEESLAHFYPSLTRRGIIPTVEMPSETVVRTLDRFALSRVFGNIINNAVKYSEGDLSVSLGKDGEIVFLNKAPGLSEVEVEKLFNRFYTVETARNSSGLGLAIAKTIVEQMGGEILAKLENGVLGVHVCFAPG